MEAFSHCAGLKNIYLPDSISSIGQRAFQHCVLLESITLPVGIKQIHAETFYDCQSLKKVDIPKNVKVVYVRAFSGCSSLEEANYGGAEEDLTIEKSGNQDITGLTINYGAKITNPMAASGKTAKVKYKKLRKKNQKLSRSGVINVSHAKGKVTYKLVSVSKKKYKKYFKIASNGVVTLKKKLKKGTYTIKCKVSDAGTDDYKPLSRTVTFKIKVK